MSIKLKGNPQQKLAQVERVINRLMRRSQKTVGVMTIPFPVSHYQEVPHEGNLFRYVFPGNGEVTRFCFYAEETPKDAKVQVEIKSPGRIISDEFPLRPSGIMQEISLSVEMGMRLRIFTESELKGIWLAFLWQPKINEHLTQNFAIEKLEEIMERFEVGEE